MLRISPKRTVLAAWLLALTVAACGPEVVSQSPAIKTTPANVDAPKIGTPSVVATGLRTPWGVAFLPDGSALVTERDTAEVKRVAGDAVQTVGKVQGVEPDGEGGLLGIAIEPGVNPSRVFVYFTSSSDNRIATLPWDGKALGATTPVFTGIPKNTIHDGGRITFGPDGFLYAGTGDADDGENSQNLQSLGGKILRITTDGNAAPGNPFGNSPVWSLGHRNVQGLAFDSQKRLWAAEFGQNLHDELNLITKGSNYGWPIHEGIASDAQYSDPYVQWPTAEASPSGLAIVNDWAYMAALRGERLWQIGIAQPAPDGPFEQLVGEYGRLRTPTVAPDGSLWVTTSNTDGRGDPKPDDDKILRVPVG